MATSKNPPGSWWRVACESIHHPIACVDLDDRFLWVNEAYERLVGYSKTELSEMTWREITTKEDLGGDLKSVEQLRAGEIDRYTLNKRYIHKSGEEVEVTLSVWRFPRFGERIVCFIAEAVPAMASAEELRKAKSDCEGLVKALESRLLKIESNQRDYLVRQKTALEKLGLSDSSNKSSTSGVNISFGNGTQTWVTYAIIAALIAGACYVAYLGTWHTHGGGADPPPQPGIHNPIGE